MEDVLFKNQCYLRIGAMSMCREQGEAIVDCGKALNKVWEMGCNMRMSARPVEHGAHERKW